MRLSKHILLFIFCFLLTPSIIAQKETKKPLKHVLSEIERHYEVSFTYADKNIEDISIIPPPVDFEIQKVLNYLQEYSGLTFQRLNERFIAIAENDRKSFSVCGYLKDSISRESVYGATIKVNGQFTVSDGKGYFQLRNISPDSALIIQSLSYENEIIKAEKLTKTSCPVILLQPAVMTLQTVVVKNYISKGINKHLDGSIMVDAHNLGILPGLIEPDVLQTVQALPGIQSINETVSDINVRGGTNDQNLVTWNGIKMYQTGHFFGMISAFNPYLTDEVEVIKNGSEASLGEAVSSSILITTDDNIPENFSGSAGINMIYGDLYTKIPLSSKASLQLSSRRSITDWIKTPTYDQYFERVFTNTDIVSENNRLNQVLDADEDFHFYDYSIKFLYDISPKDKLRLNLLNIYNNIEYIESAVIDNKVEAKTSGLEQHSMATGLMYSRFWKDNLKTNLHLDYSRYQLDALNFDILKNQRLEQGNEVLDNGFKIDLQNSISNNLFLSTGYDFSEIDITNREEVNNPDFSQHIKEGTQAHALFLQGNYSSPSEKLNLQGGLRMNYYSKPDEFTLEPRIAVNQQLLKNFTVEVLGEYKSQVTSQIIDLQNAFLGVEKRRWILSNGLDIPVIKSRQISLGLNYIKNKFMINLEGYYKEVDGITSSSQGFQNQFQYVRSAGAYQTTGFDFLINKTVLDINTWLSYSYIVSTYHFPEFTPAVFPNNLDVRNIITFGSSYKNNDLELSWGLNWHTGKPYTQALSVEGPAIGSIVYEAPNNSTLENYFRIDLSVKYNFKMGKNSRGQVGPPYGISWIIKMLLTGSTAFPITAN